MGKGREGPKSRDQRSPRNRRGVHHRPGERPQGKAGFLVLKQRLSVFGPKCGGGALEDGITMRR